eukprot:gene8879-9829_t
MDWFNTSGISHFAKSAVSKAQKSIDKVLDIRDETEEMSTGSTSSRELREGGPKHKIEKTPHHNNDKRTEDRSKMSRKDTISPKVSKLSISNKNEDLIEDSFFDEFLQDDSYDVDFDKSPKVKRGDTSSPNSKAVHTSNSFLKQDLESSPTKVKVKRESNAKVSNVLKTIAVDANEIVERDYGKVNKTSDETKLNTLKPTEESNEISTINKQIVMSNEELLHCDKETLQVENDLTKYKEELDKPVGELDKPVVTYSNDDLDSKSLNGINHDVCDKGLITDESINGSEKADSFSDEIVSNEDSSSKEVVPSEDSSFTSKELENIEIVESDHMNILKTTPDPSLVAGDNDQLHSKLVLVSADIIEDKASKKDVDVSDGCERTCLTGDVNENNDIASSEEIPTNDALGLQDSQHSTVDGHIENTVTVPGNVVDEDNSDVVEEEHADVTNEDHPASSNDAKSNENVSGSLEDDAKDISVMQQEVVQLKALVEAREAKMISLSKENIELKESISFLAEELDCSELITSKYELGSSFIRDEFSRRIVEVTNRLSETIQERDNLQHRVDESDARLSKSSNELIASYSATLSEKEKIIADLLEEGEMLSKRELKITTTAKKLRAKVRDLETKIDQYRIQSEKADSECLKLKKTLKEKEDKEALIQDQLKKLEAISDQQEDEISTLKDHLDDAEDKLKGMQTTLDCGYQEINRLNLENSSIKSEIQEVTSVKQAREELRSRISDIEKSAAYEREQACFKIDDLQRTIERTELAANRREESLKLEVSELQKRLEEAESRNQELSQSIGAASRPLLRQIENLQNSHHNQALNWERVEKHLNDRLASCQHQLALFTDKERSAVEVALEMKNTIARLEIQLDALKCEKKELNSELLKRMEIVDELEDSLKREGDKFESSERYHKKIINELQNEKMTMENQLATERVRFEMLKGEDARRKSNSLSRQSSEDSTFKVNENSPQDDILMNTTKQQQRSRSSSMTSSSQAVDPATKNTTSTAAMEQLQSSLRQKEGELQVLRDEVLTLQKTRSSLAEELVNLSNLVDDLQVKCEDRDTLLERNQDLESRYNAVLQMYGEKAEEVEELKMDLYDVKQMYKQQSKDNFAVTVPKLSDNQFVVKMVVELYDLGKQLWNADSKMRLRSGMDFVLDLQNTAYQGYDSTRPLFRSVNQTAIDKPTFRALRTLFDNYYREVGRAEYVSDQEVSENWKFLNTIVSTKTISIVYQFLKSKGRVTNFSDFKTKLYNMWFGLYSRKSSQSVRDSSGFEHIFVGETDWYKVSGFHNWLRLYLQEQSRKVDYEGYFTSTNSAHLKAFRFSWYNKPKTYGSFFLGTSPEFEVAIYSLTAFSGVRNPVFKYIEEYEEEEEQKEEEQQVKEDGDMYITYYLYDGVSHIKETRIIRGRNIPEPNTSSSLNITAITVANFPFLNITKRGLNAAAKNGGTSNEGKYGRLEERGNGKKHDEKYSINSSVDFAALAVLITITTISFVCNMLLLLCAAVNNAKLRKLLLIWIIWTFILSILTIISIIIALINTNIVIDGIRVALVYGIAILLEVFCVWVVSSYYRYLSMMAHGPSQGYRIVFNSRNTGGVEESNETVLSRQPTASVSSSAYSNNTEMSVVMIGTSGGNDGTTKQGIGGAGTTANKEVKL